LKDYYEILGVSENSTAADIKKAYRKIALKYHPDKNKEPGSEEKFKEAADAYSIIGDPNKRAEYDRKRRPRTSDFRGFDDWVKEDFWKGPGQEFGSNRFRQSRSRGNRPNSDTKYLNIYENVNSSLIDLLEGKPINVSYTKKVVDGEMIKSDEEKNINIHVNLKKKKVDITRKGNSYMINIKLEGLGHEDVYNRINAWGDTEKVLLVGDYHLLIDIDVPEGIELEDGNIIQQFDVPLYKVLIPGEKIRITTILDKSYDAEVNNPKRLNNLKFNIKQGGYLSKSGTLGNYVIMFNITPPDLSDLSNDEIDQLKKHLM
jgi:DnaJ-class molecular chaperone